MGSIRNTSNTCIPKYLLWDNANIQENDLFEGKLYASSFDPRLAQLYNFDSLSLNISFSINMTSIFYFNTTLIISCDWCYF